MFEEIYFFVCRPIAVMSPTTQQFQKTSQSGSIEAYLFVVTLRMLYYVFDP